MATPTAGFLRVQHIRGLKGYDDGGPVASDFSQLTAPPDFDSRWQEVQDAVPMFNRPAGCVSSPLPVIDADAAGLGKPWIGPIQPCKQTQAFPRRPLRELPCRRKSRPGSRMGTLGIRRQRR